MGKFSIGSLLDDEEGKLPNEKNFYGKHNDGKFVYIKTSR